MASPLLYPHMYDGTDAPGPMGWGAPVPPAVPAGPLATPPMPPVFSAPPHPSMWAGIANAIGLFLANRAGVGGQYAKNMMGAQDQAQQRWLARQNAAAQQWRWQAEQAHQAAQDAETLRHNKATETYQTSALTGRNEASTRSARAGIVKGLIGQYGQATPEQLAWIEAGTDEPAPTMTGTPAEGSAAWNRVQGVTDKATGRALGFLEQTGSVPPGLPYAGFSPSFTAGSVMGNRAADTAKVNAEIPGVAADSQVKKGTVDSRITKARADAHVAATKSSVAQATKAAQISYAKLAPALRQALISATQSIPGYRAGQLGIQQQNANTNAARLEVYRQEIADAIRRGDYATAGALRAKAVQVGGDYGVDPNTILPPVPAPGMPAFTATGPDGQAHNVVPLKPAPGLHAFTPANLPPVIGPKRGAGGKGLKSTAGTIADGSVDPTTAKALAGLGVSRNVPGDYALKSFEYWRNAYPGNDSTSGLFVSKTPNDIRAIGEIPPSDLQVNTSHPQYRAYMQDQQKLRDKYRAEHGGSGGAQAGGLDRPTMNKIASHLKQSAAHMTLAQLRGSDEYKAASPTQRTLIEGYWKAGLGPKGR